MSHDNIKQCLLNLVDLGVTVQVVDEKLRVTGNLKAVDKDTKSFIAQNKDGIIAYINDTKKRLADVGKTVIPRQNNTDGVLSFAQKRLWFVDRMEGASPQYNLPGALKLNGTFDVEIAQNAFSRIIKRHESMRTIFDEKDGKPFQVIRSDFDFTLTVHDLTELDSESQAERVEQLVSEDALKAFDLSQDLMVRASYLKCADSAGVLLFNMHHIASDGWSMGILMSEFVAQYKALSMGQPDPLEPLPVQYADYALWQQDYLQTDAHQQDIDYWHKQLADVPIVHGLPLDFERPAQPEHQGGLVSQHLSSDVVKQLNTLCRAEGVTSFMVLHAAFALLLDRHGTNQDIVIGSPVANRMEQSLNGLIGFFVNMVVLRSSSNSSDSFIDYLSQIKQINLDAQAHQNIPFEQLVDLLQVPRNAQHMPLFQIVLSMDNNARQSLCLDGLTIDQVDSGVTQAKFDIELNVQANADSIELRWMYDQALFKPQTIERLNRHLVTLLEGIVATPQSKLSQLQMLSEQEINQQLYQYNDTKVDYPKDKLMHQLFIEQVAKTPDAVAVIDSAGELSYRELFEQSLSLSFQLQKLDLRFEELVAVRLPRGRQQVIATMGILMAGGAYLPMEVQWPHDRCQGVLQRAQCRYYIVDDNSHVLPEIDGLQPLLLDSLIETSDPFHLTNALEQFNYIQKPQDLAYVIFTSGSTGLPKGVAIEHGMAVNTLYDINAKYEVTEKDRVMAVSALSFDLSVYDIFGLLAVGGSIVYPQDDKANDPLHWLEMVEQHQVTLWDTVPVSAGLLVEQLDVQQRISTAPIRNVLMSGDWIAPALPAKLKRCFPGVNVYSMGGATEGSIWSIYYPILEDTTRWKSVPYGKPLGNQAFYILDSDYGLLPTGVVGELYIGGDGVAREYFADPELSAQRFIHHPQYGMRLYRTGDMGRYREDGNIEFAGRVDDQVKINGFRIELGEIQKQLTALAEVNKALVLAHEDDNGHKQLIAYVEPANHEMGSETDIAQLTPVLRSGLAKKLTGYMIPKVFILVEKWPVTANGKLDKKALPKPDFSAVQGDYFAPETELEQQLTEIWGDLLKRPSEQISRTANFFESGGDSLMAVRLMSEIRTRLSVEIAVKDVFENAMLSDLASQIERHSRISARPAVEKVDSNKPLPLSFAQQRLWLIDQIEGSSVHYNMPAALLLSGNLNITALNQALTAIFERHEALRTVFVPGADEEPVQVVQAVPSVSVETVDLSEQLGLHLHLLETEQGKAGVAAGELPQALMAHIEPLVLEHGRFSFDLAKDLMLQVKLIKLGEGQHILLFNMHHIASDGWSLGLLISEFNRLYGAFDKGQANPLAPLPVQYGDYAHWQRQWLQGEVLEEQLNYWRDQLSGIAALHRLPLDKPRPAVQTFEGATCFSEIDASATQQLMNLCQLSGATLFMGLHSVFSVLLARYSNETDIVIGTPVANRDQSEIAELIGFFVNTLVLRTDLTDEANPAGPSFVQLLGQNKQMLLDAYEHQQVPFEKIVEQLQPERNLSHSPLFQVMLVLQNNETDDLNLTGLELTPLKKSAATAMFDLKLNVAQHANGLSLSWEYNTALFNASTIEGMAAHFETLLNLLVQSPNESVFAGNMLNEEQTEKQLQLAVSPEGYPKDICLHHRFEQLAAQTPDAEALLYTDAQGIQQSMSYGQLNTKANQLARLIVERNNASGQGEEPLVLLYLDRSVHMLISIMAVLKAGAGYVPIGVDFPKDRVGFIAEDSGSRILLSQSWLKPQESVLAHVDGDIELLLVDELDFDDMPQSGDDLSLHRAVTDLACVLYTSGTTGKPKGVMITHQNVFNRFYWVQQQYPMSASERWLLKTPYTFDVSLIEIFWTQQAGCTLVIAPPESHKDPLALDEILRDFAVNMVHFVPSMLSVYCEYLSDTNKQLPESINRVLCSGEALTKAHIDEFRAISPDYDNGLLNLYGPTEAGEVSWFDTLDYRDGPVPIGRPVANLQLLVLNQNQQLVPFGSPGELYIGGAGVARGYLNRAQLSQERFIEHPLALPGNALYKTGDVVRWMPEGELEYLGRNDFQLKIRGNRVEAGEIENTLTEMANIRQALVLAYQGELVAYVLLNNPIEVTAHDDTIAAIKAELAQSLPEYMVPTAVIILEHLPLTNNGKVDRNALPTPSVTQSSQATRHYVAPSNETEAALCDIWQQVLGIDKVGVQDNFFALGGHSLSATRVMAKIAQKLNIRLPLKQLFVHQSIEGLAAVLLEAKATSADGQSPLTKVERSSELPLSFAQQRLWMLDQIEGNSVHYNLPVALRLTGTLDIKALNMAFSSIVERHESLRTVFAPSQVEGRQGEAVQRICEAAPVEIEVVDLSQSKDEAEQSRLLMQRVAAHRSYAYDLSRDSMLQLALVKLADIKAQAQHVLLFNVHHIASDGWSNEILVKEFCALYTAFTQGSANPLEPLTLQYADYAHWQRNWLKGEVLEQQLGYWSKQLADLPTLHNLPLDKPRPSVQTFNGATHLAELEQSVSEQFNRLCSESGATLFMGLHAAFSVLLARYANETDVVVGTAVANREQAEIADLIGFFVNTLVLRSDLSEAPSFAQLLSQSKQTLLEAYEHQQVPFEKLVELLQPERSLGHSPLFQVMLVLQNNEASQLNLPGLELAPLESMTGTVAKYDLTLNVIEDEQGLSFGWEYNTDLFEADSIKSMAEHFNLLLGAIVKTQGQTGVYELPMLTEQEQQQQLVEWHGKQVDYPKDQCIVQLFEAQAARSPQALAVLFESGVGESEQLSFVGLSYAELNERANQLANYLVDKRQVKPDTLVGLCVERSLDMVIGIYAILKAGGAYVPLSPDAPTERLQYMIEDAELGTVLTQQQVRANLPVENELVICLDDPKWLQSLAHYDTTDESVVKRRAANGLPEPTANNLAYLIYTSGSTGQPKGVMVEHQALVNRIDWMDREYLCSDKDKVLQKTPYTFDVSVWEFIWPLVTGAQLVVARPNGHTDPQYMAKLIRRQGITKCHFVPSMLSSMLMSNALNDCITLHQVFCSGEALSVNQVESFKKALPLTQLHNLYGPTEAAIDVSYWDCSGVAANTIPIGRAIQNVQLLVLDAHLNLCPTGAVGELHIGGDALARGYFKQSELTKARFIDNPFAEQDSGSRLYKTGDLVRLQSDGTIEYLGRSDHQVKIRGLRIELGEIEYHLQSCDSVDEAVVVSKTNETLGTYLVAYVVTDTTEPDYAETAFIEGLSKALHVHLPEYMVPSAFVVLDSMPKTSNGKVDRKALPEPDMAGHQVAYVAPVSATEKLLCQVWQQVLGLEKVGINDNFFALGGHSLLVMKLIAVAEQHQLRVSAKAVFESKSLAQLAGKIDSANEHSKVQYQAPDYVIAQGCEQITPQMLPLLGNEFGDELGFEQSHLDDIAQTLSVDGTVSGGMANIADIYPLGPLQQGILFNHMLVEDSDPYVLNTLLTIDDKATVELLCKWLNQIIARHDVLRTAIVWKGLPSPVQVVLRNAQLPVTWLDSAKDEAQAKTLLGSQPAWLDLNKAPLMSLNVVPVVGDDGSTERYIASLNYHHIISDHVGLEVIQKELFALHTGQFEQLPKPVPYRDFIAQTLHQAKHYDADTFFTDMLSDVEEPTTPYGLTDVTGDGSQIVETRQAVPESVAKAVAELSQSMQCSPAVLFHAVWAMVVGACSGRDDVVFGSVFSGRLQGVKGAQDMLGVFINTLPVRVQLSNTSANGLIEQVKNTLQGLIVHEQAPLAQAQQCSGLASGSVLFSALLNYRHGAEVDEQALQDTEDMQGIEILSTQERTNYPFMLSVDDLGDEFVFALQTDNSVNGDKVMGYLQTALKTLVDNLSDNPAQPMQHLSVLDDTQRHQLLVAWNDTQAQYPEHACIHQLFEQQMQKTPDATAVVFEGQSLSYRELNEKANQLACYLVEHKQVKADTLVGLCAERSLEMVIAIYAIWKAGGAYVPLDPSYPATRLEYMINNGEINTVVTQAHLLGNAELANVLGHDKAVAIDDAQVLATLANYPADSAPLSGLSSRNLVYVFYTSGSTGQPKGVMVEHHSLVNRIDWMQRHFALTGDDKVMQKTPYSFDVSVWEFVWALSYGATLVVAKPEGHKDPRYISQLIAEQGITMVHFVPSMLNLFMEEQRFNASIRHVFCSGEALDSRLVERMAELAPHVSLDNLYGPTEASIEVSHYHCDFALQSQPSSIPIGKPIQNVQLLVLDAQQRLCPPGVPGELHIGGVAPARGYLNQPQLTAERFINNPYANETMKAKGFDRLYKTGDMARHNAAGEIVYLGRNDHQVKLNGQRIELGEIEQQIYAVEQVTWTLVMAAQDNRAKQRLVAYVVFNDDSDDDVMIELLKAELADRLPAHMIPSVLIPLESLPLTANGKLDRKALPAANTIGQDVAFVAPQTDSEKILQGIWAKLLNLPTDNISVHGNFFELGGESLLSVRLITEMQNAFGLDDESLNIRDIFVAPSICELAELVDNRALNQKLAQASAEFDQFDDVEEGEL